MGGCLCCFRSLKDKTLVKHRFRFLGQADATGHWTLSSEDAHHVQKVLRLNLGSEIEFCDGRGNWGVGTITGLGKQGVQVEALESSYEPSSECDLVLLIAAMKPASFDELLPSLVELGVDRIWVFAQNHTDRKWLSGKVLQRWQRLVASAMKQCKRSWLPELDCFTSMEALVNSVEIDSFANRIVLDPSAELSLIETPLQKSSTLLAVGSEKGLSPMELQLLSGHGFLSARIGQHILRAYTASLAGVSVLSARRIDN